MEETTAKKPGGKREGQKYKSLLVWDILLKKTDENHALQLKDIKEHLAHYGILLADVIIVQIQVGFFGYFHA